MYFASYRARGGGSWGAPFQIGSNPSSSTSISDDLLTAIAPDGTAAAGIDHTDPAITTSPGGSRIDIAVVSPSGAWGSPTQVSPLTDDSENATMAFDSADNLTVAFSLSQSGTSSGRLQINTVTRSGTVGVWAAPTAITTSSTDYASSAPRLSVGADGSAVLAFQYAAGATIDAWGTTRSGASGSWTPIADLTTGSASAAPSAVGMSPTDEAYVLYTYQASLSTNSCIGAVRAAAGGTFSSAACTSALNYQPSSITGVAFLGNDAYWTTIGQPNGGSAYDLEVDRWRDSAAAADTPTTIVAPASSAPSVLAITNDQDGGVPVVFDPSGGDTSLSVSAYDSGGPLLTFAGVPSTAVAGQPVTFNASFVDLWSSPASAPSWTFGDGGTGNGATVTHTYAAAGTYTVTAASSDVLGNTTTSPFTITVSAPTPSPTPTPTPTPTPKPKPTPSAVTLTGLAQSAARWLEHAPRHAKGKRPSVGTRFGFTLNAAADVTLTFTGIAAGRRVGHGCAAPSRRNRKHKPCRRTISESETLSGIAGANSVRFDGTVTGYPALPPGHYKVTAGASGQTAPAESLSFTILSLKR